MNSPSSPTRGGSVLRCNARITVKEGKGEKKEKYTLEQAAKVQRGSRDIALLFL